MSDITDEMVEALAKVIRPWTMCDDAGRFDHGSDRAARAVLESAFWQDHAGGVREALAEVGLPGDASLDALIEHHRANAALAASMDLLADRMESDGDHAGTMVTAEQAWDEGYTAGHSNAMRRMSDEPNAPATPNPYRLPVQQDGSAAKSWQCPVHDMPDCSPLLNGCSHQPFSWQN